MNKKALVVGINYYEQNSLNSCVKDARSIAEMLEYNQDNTRNFDVNLCVACDAKSKITTRDLKDEINQLYLQNSCDIALLYFSGHGAMTDTGGYLCTSNGQQRDDGVSLDEIAKIVSKSKAHNNIIILDCCHSGSVGDNLFFGNNSIISENTTYLTACTNSQYAIEDDGGVFTNLLLDGLDGGSSNIIGEISPASLYSHIDRSLGTWEQRPVFKTNTQSFVCVRKVNPQIELSELRQIKELFPSKDGELELDPTFEPDCKNQSNGKYEPDLNKMKKFALLQKMVQLNLVEPVGEQHMFYAAMNNKSCKLKPLGKHYWNLASKNRF